MAIIISIIYFQVRGIETVTTYDPRTGEFVINTPCESAQKYWIGGAAKVSRHICHLVSPSDFIRY